MDDGGDVAGVLHGERREMLAGVIGGTEETTTSRALREVRPSVRELTMADGRRVHLLAEGRVLNLAAAEGHPASVMDVSFADQALGAEFMAREGPGLERRGYATPRPIDEENAALELGTPGGGGD